MECDYALCSLFAPGDRHVIIGTKVRYVYTRDQLISFFLIVCTHTHNRLTAVDPGLPGLHSSDEPGELSQ